MQFRGACGPSDFATVAIKPFLRDIMGDLVVLLGLIGEGEENADAASFDTGLLSEDWESLKLFMILERKFCFTVNLNESFSLSCSCCLRICNLCPKGPSSRMYAYTVSFLRKMLLFFLAFL